jgi:hypothetical protein
MKPGFVSTLVVLLSLAGCTSPRTPLVIAPALEAEAIREVLVLPVIDARPTRYDHTQVARNVEEAMVRFLRERGYFVTTADTYSVRPTVPLDLHIATAEQLVPLAPEDAQYFLLVQVERLEPGGDASQTRYARPIDRAEEGIDANVQTWDARLSAVLVDKAGARVVWRDVATASSTLGGVLTVFSRGSIQYEAAVNASRLLVQTLPDKRPPGQKRTVFAP